MYFYFYKIYQYICTYNIYDILKYRQFSIVWWNSIYFSDVHFVGFMSDKLILKRKMNARFLPSSF